MKHCADCGERVGIRATRCKDCRRIHRTNYERDRVTAAREKRAAEESACEPLEFPSLGRGVVDYTGGGTRPPSPDVHRPAPRAEPSNDVVDYSRGGSNGPRPPAPPDFSRVPASVRQDRVRAEQMARELARQDAESELTSWEILTSRGQDDGHLVSFRPSMDGSVLRGGGSPVTAITNPAANGTLYAAPARPRQNRASGQRLPHILN
jgi:hypothetical protein